MLQIDQLKLHLPKGLEHRAADIAQELARQLSGLSLPKGQRIDSLAPLTIKIHAQATNREIARAMATALQSGMGGQR